MAEQVTAERVRELLHYDAETGAFTWISNRHNGRAGKPAGSWNHQRGYLTIHVDGHWHYGHRLAWLYVTGLHPNMHIDHINRDCSDNRFSNLRLATQLQNNQNIGIKPPRHNRTSKMLGASWHKASGKWRAAIRLNNKAIHIGLFDTAEAAHAAYIQKKRELHPFGRL